MTRTFILATGALLSGMVTHAEVIDLSATGLENPESTIDFSRPTFPDVTQITDQFANLGVTFDPHLYYRTSAHADWTNVRGPNLRSGDPIVRTFSLRFESPLSSAALVAIAQPPTPATITARLNGVDIESFDSTVTIDNPDNYFGFTGIVFDEIEIAYTAETRMRIDNLQLGPSVSIEGPPLRVSSNEDELTFTWGSQSGKLYNLLSVTDPAVSEPKDWPVFGEMRDIVATPPENSLTIPRPDEAVRFFAVEAFDAPPVEIASDDFENGVGDWTSGSDGAIGTLWELGSPAGGGPVAAHSPSNCFATNISGSYGVDAEVWLRSPVIDLATAGGATLRYHQFLDIEEGFDFGTVRLLDASDDSELAVLLSPVEGISTGWEEVTRPLPAEALGKSIKIEFRFTSDELENFAGWYLDDFAVTVP